MKKFLIWPALAVLYAGAIFYGSSIPAPELPQIIGSFSDKFLHGVEYAILGILLHRTFSRQPRWSALSDNATLLAIFIAVVYGASDEFHQSFVPGRSTELRDWVADAIGAIAGVMISLIANAIMNRRAAGPSKR